LLQIGNVADGGAGQRCGARGQYGRSGRSGHGGAVFKTAMSVLLRTLVVLVRAWFAPRSDVLQESVLRFRVMPDDLDVNVHMNNGRYLALMDLGRFDVMLRAGLYRPGSHRKRWPLIGSAMIRFRRSLELFRAFELRTRVVGWDGRWFFFEQRFEHAGAICCVALARGLFRTAEGSLRPVEILREAGFPTESPPLPEYVQRWVRADDEAYAAAREAMSVPPGIQ
jgi:acyl-CoA thioesterase FadM